MRFVPSGHSSCVSMGKKTSSVNSKKSAMSSTPEKMSSGFPDQLFSRMPPLICVVKCSSWKLRRWPTRPWKRQMTIMYRASWMKSESRMNTRARRHLRTRVACGPAARVSHFDGGCCCDSSNASRFLLEPYSCLW